jgi:cell division transport system ATP-binding protein
MITFSHIFVQGTGRWALEDIDLTINPGEFACIIGSSGAGKSILLNLLTRELQPTHGEVHVDGVNLRKLSPQLLQVYRREIGVMMQQEQLLTDRSIASNIALPLELHGMEDDATAEHVTELLEMIGLYEKAAFLPQALSLDERRRVAFAQAIAMYPKILLLDEPFADVEDSTRTLMTTILKALQNGERTILLATHYPKIADTLGTRVIRMEKGRIHADSARKVQSAAPRARATSSHSITPSRV